MLPTPIRGACSLIAAVLALAVGCEEDTAEQARETIRDEHLPAMKAVVAEDVERHLIGIRKAADRLAPGFVVDDPAKRETQMRTALRYVQEPPKGIREFITSPMSFLAAVGPDGVVLARDAEPDRMKGMDMTQFPVVREALKSGEVGTDLGEFKGEAEGESSWSILFAAPVEADGERVGAVVAGIPLWRLAQRLSRQMRVDHAPEIEEGLVLWAYLLKGDRLFYKGTPPELDDRLPKPAELQKQLREAGDPATGHLQLHGRTYGYGVTALPEVGDDVALVVVRGSP